MLSTTTLLAVLAAVPSLVSAAPTTKDRGFAIPIAKRNGSGLATRAANTPVDAAKLNGQLANLRAKYATTLSNFEKNTGAAHPNAAGVNLSKRATAADSLTDSSEELWYGKVSVGTPAVTYTVDFDTGSSDFFLPDSSCSSCGSHTKYKPSSSSSSAALGKKFTLSYGDGSTTSGKQYTDVVSIGSLKAKTQTLGSATTYSSSFQSGPTDGLMGLAYPSLSAFPATPFFNTLIDNSAVSAGQFGFYLAESGSELYFGGADSSKYSGDINWNSVTSEGYWQISMDSIDVSDSPAVSGLSVIVDSGTTLIVGDADNVATFYSQIEGSADASSTVGDGFYTFPCSSASDISVGATFNGVSYSISSDYFNLGQASDGSSDCVGGVVSDAGLSGGSTGFWIMGDVFMRNVYTVFDFDNNQVGFASL